jgi:hypothetical protein
MVSGSHQILHFPVLSQAWFIICFKLSITFINLMCIVDDGKELIWNEWIWSKTIIWKSLLTSWTWLWKLHQHWPNLLSQQGVQIPWMIYFISISGLSSCCSQFVSFRFHYHKFTSWWSIHSVSYIQTSFLVFSRSISRQSPSWGMFHSQSSQWSIPSDGLFNPQDSEMSRSMKSMRQVSIWIDSDIRTDSSSHGHSTCYSHYLFIVYFYY